jgi:hypothetical protein
MEGWLKLHRKIYDNPKSKNPDWVAVWVFLLCHVTHKEQKSTFGTEEIILKPGQIITGRTEISKKTGVKETTVERVLSALESGQQIEQQKCTRGRLITLLKWQEYQSGGQQKRQQMDNKWTADGQQVDTNKNRRIEEYKEVFIGLVPAELLVIENFLESWTNWILFRFEKSEPLTERSAKSQFKTLIANKADAIAIIEKSINANWTGLFPLKKQSNGNNNTNIGRGGTGRTTDTLADTARQSSDRLARHGISRKPDTVAGFPLEQPKALAARSATG